MTQMRAASRLSRADREQQILEAAARLVVEQGCLPLPLELLAARAGVSKALVYAYFPTQGELASRLLRQHLVTVGHALDAVFSAQTGPRDLALQCAGIYFDQVAETGPLLHILLGDPLADAALPSDLRGLYARQMRRLAKGVSAHFGVPAGEAIAALHILLALPEEAGSLVFRGRLDRVLGRSLTRQMVDGALTDLSLRLAKAPARPAPN